VTQGEENLRQSSSYTSYLNNAKAVPDALLDYLKSVEILNNHYLCGLIITGRFKNILIKK
jgi:hypothetical protein